MKDDLQRKFTISSHTLVCFSIGYFLYDALDMILNHRKRSTYELLLHHGLVVLCYSVAVISKQFVAFVALSLIVEVNSVFLHARQLFIITSEPRNSPRYKTNALLNVVTFLIFRIILLAWMTRWLTFQRSTISFGFLAVGIVGLGVIVRLIFIIYFYLSIKGCMMCVIPFVTVSYKTQRAKRKDRRGVLRSSSELKKINQINFPGYHEHYPFLPNCLYRHASFQVLKNTEHNINNRQWQ